MIVVRNSSLEAGVSRRAGEGVVVNNVHYNRNACVVQSLNHLLALVDSYVTVVGVRRIRALGNVVVLRIIAPVKLVVRASLVD